MVRAVEADLPKPSTVASPEQRRELAGDLDTIIAKAMHRSPERRYASAQQLADDIRRHLVGLPVHARPDTVVYRLKKYAQRHRAGFVAAALSFVAISVGLFAAVWQSGVAAAKDREAQKRFMEVRDLARWIQRSRTFRARRRLGRFWRERSSTISTSWRATTYRTSR
jgi:hypothetical protein